MFLKEFEVIWGLFLINLKKKIILYGDTPRGLNRGLQQVLNKSLINQPPLRIGEE